jgi:hypothetical protein
MRFKKGDKVKWETVGRGSRKTREGEIFATVPAMADPRAYTKDKPHLRFGSALRETPSYLVMSDDILYWPPTLKLTVV